MSWRALSLFVLASAVPVVGCGDDVVPPLDAGTDATVDATDAEPDVGDTAPPEPDLDCDPLVPTICALPFPSSYYEADDPVAVTGRRLAFGERTFPPARRDRFLPTDAFDGVDGFSISTGPVAHLPLATYEGLARPDSIARSLEANAKTIILAVDDGTRVPHFVDIDATVSDESQRAMILRPIVPLEHDQEYIVAIRNVVDATGVAIPPTPAFAALRDGGEHPHPSVDARRDEFAEIFARLDEVGVDASELQLAWRFHTRSEANTTAAMLHMRNVALDAAGDDGLGIRIDRVEPRDDENVRMKVFGHVTVPHFLDSPDAGARLVLGDDGLPMRGEDVEYPFEMIVPRSATPDNPAAITAFGHGLFGTADQVDRQAHHIFANTYNHVLFAMDWIGMSNPDADVVGNAIIEGRFEEFRSVPDRLRQSMVNKLVAMRAISGDLIDHEELLVDGERILDPSARYYYGGSQGGIFGSTYMALSTDVTRGGLRVPGQPYGLLLARSVDFDPYFALFRIAYRETYAATLMIGLAQIYWDTVEPGTYTSYIREPFPDTPPHEVLLQVALGDHQVTTLGAHIMARVLDAKTIAPQTRPIYEVAEVEGPHAGSAIVEYDFGLPEDPLENQPQRAGEDPHGKVKSLAAAQAQLDHFFRTGEVIHTCDGTCDPE